MIKVTSALALATLALGLSSASFAASSYAITNNDNPSGNSASVFKAAATPVLTKTLTTGGTGLGGGYFAAPRVGIENNAACVFVTDSGSGDIATFSKATGFAKVGNYSNGSLAGDVYGIGVAASSDGKYLYAAYSATLNLAVWTVNSDCSLTLGPIASEADYVAPIALSSDNKALVVSQPNNQALDTWAVPALTEINSVSLSSISACSSTGCYVTGIDISNVSGGNAVVEAGNATLSGPYYVQATLNTTTGISSSSVTNNALSSSGLANIESPLFTKGGAAGNGILYFGAAGFGSGYPAGVAVTTFNGTSATYNSAAVNSSAYYASNPALIQLGSNLNTGKGVWQAYYDGNNGNNYITYAVLSGTTLTYGTHPVEITGGAGSYVLSITSFPPR